MKENEQIETEDFILINSDSSDSENNNDYIPLPTKKLEHNKTKSPVIVKQEPKSPALKKNSDENVITTRKRKRVLFLPSYEEDSDEHEEDSDLSDPEYKPPLDNINSSDGEMSEEYSPIKKTKSCLKLKLQKVNKITGNHSLITRLNLFKKAHLTM